MGESWLSQAAAVLKNMLVALTGATGAVTGMAQAGVIHEIEAGNGPAWGSMSGLTAHPTDPSRLYAVTDKNASPIRILEIELKPASARVVGQIEIQAPGLKGLDTEGIVAKPGGGFWLAAEGGRRNQPPNLLIEVDGAGVMQRSIGLPDKIARLMPKKGIEGVALQMTPSGSRLAVAFQVPIDGDPEGFTRIGLVDPSTSEWRFYLYPLHSLGSGDYTGLSELLHLSGSRFACIERDGEGGRSSFKWVTTFDLGAHAGSPANEIPPKLTKRQVIDLVPVFQAAGRKVEKEIEGLAITTDGQMYVVTDNDSDSARPTLLLRLGNATSLF